MYVSLETKVVKSPKVNVSKRKLNPLTTTLLVLLYIAVLLFIGFSEFVSAGFDWSIVGTAEWWSKTITAIAINNIILLGTIMYLLQRDLESKPEVLEERKRVDSASLQFLDPVTFDPWLVGFNLKRKIRKYKMALSDRMDKLNKNVKPKDLEAWVNYQKELKKYEELVKLKPDDETNTPPKSKNKYVNKRLTIEIQMSDEFINERIHYMRMNYKPIKKQFVTSGYMGSRSTDDDYDVEHGGMKMFKDLGPKIIITAGYLAFINSLVVDLVAEPNYMVAIIAIVLKLVPIIMQIYNAVNYKNAFIRDKVMVDFRTRWDIIVRYAAETGKRNDKKEEPKKEVKV